MLLHLRVRGAARGPKQASEAGRVRAGQGRLDLLAAQWLSARPRLKRTIG